MRWKRGTDPWGDDLPNRYTWGDWLIWKEFYADGPSMFVWVVTGPKCDREEFGTLREAKVFAETYGLDRSTLPSVMGFAIDEDG